MSRAAIPWIAALPNGKMRFSENPYFSLEPFREFIMLLK